jgi:hypothetical protein
VARHRRAIAIAEARREGHTWIRIAAMFGVTRVRPAWSYPDDELLRLSRDGRAEIAAAERARRFG